MNISVNNKINSSTILVVDDDIDILEVMQDFLEDIGHEVITAKDGLAGYTVASERDFDLIILDIDMPGMSGVELCRKLRQAERTKLTPIVIQTGFTDDATLLEGLDAGCDEFINKPPNVPVLKARVRSLLRISHQRSEIVAANIDLDHKLHLLELSEADLKKVVSEKEGLLKELYHRTKNNMQSITSLLNLQMYQTNDPTLEQAFRVTQDRIRSMALVHKKLYQSKSLDHVDLGEYLQELANELVYSYASDKDQIKLSIQQDPVQITLAKAIPIGLIVNELITNSLKYAFPENTLGALDVTVKDLGGDEIQVMVSDNGKGLPEGANIFQGASLGFRLVRSIAEDQLMGKLDIPPRNSGLSVAVRFSLVD